MAYEAWLRKQAESVLTIPQGCVWFIALSSFSDGEVYVCADFLHALFLFFTEV